MMRRRRLQERADPDNRFLPSLRALYPDLGVVPRLASLIVRPTRTSSPRGSRPPSGHTSVARFSASCLVS